MFTELIQRIPYPDYVQILSQALINVDITYDYTYGRGIVDAAALKVPTVGSDTIEAMRDIWPELTITPGKDWQMETIVKKLLDNEDWRDLMAQRGTDHCEIYSQKNSYERMTGICE
jgi:glycosyltransferase involved in cell wall biosynthesis